MAQMARPKAAMVTKGKLRRVIAFTWATCWLNSSVPNTAVTMVRLSQKLTAARLRRDDGEVEPEVDRRQADGRRGHAQRAARQHAGHRSLAQQRVERLALLW